ncbi:MAG: ABC transporter ATP-binding protein [Thermodesulfovibrionales bacterium]|nr:ABC transporter ATP-binding protein [Thermodesulfovibrionales bacterium]
MLKEALLKVDSLKKYFPYKGRGYLKKSYIRAVDGISFSVSPNTVFAIVGESGSGKSTVANLILRLIEPTDGHIYFRGQDIFTLKGEELSKFRRSVQIIFQDPFASLNPRMRIIEALSEPFQVHKILNGSKLKEQVVQLLEKVGLSDDALYKYPHEFSGGQRQRICIARALALSPELIVADEPLSALDVSIQAQILNLFLKIKEEASLSFVFISHDLKVVRYFSDIIAVMYRGKIVEMAESENLFSKPLHPYTKLLIASAPEIRTKRSIKRESPLSNFDSTGEILSLLQVPKGCSFYDRCAERMEICSKKIPDNRNYDGRSIACHHFDCQSKALD